MSRIDNLIDAITISNEAYRGNGMITKIFSIDGIEYGIGETIPDHLYDSWKDEVQDIDPENPILFKIGLTPDTREVELRITMASMEKEKTAEAVIKHFVSKGISTKETVVLTPKYDGCSGLFDEYGATAATRGDGVIGQDITDHYRIIEKNYRKGVRAYTIGEIIMPFDIFEGKYSKSAGGNFENQRNMISGKLRDETPIVSIMEDCRIVKYGIILEKEGKFIEHDKTSQLKMCIELGSPVKYQTAILGELTDELLVGLYNEWSDVFELDGIIVELDDAIKRAKMGRERNGNPSYAVAYKGDGFCDYGDTTVLNIRRQVSKHGLVKPVLDIVPIRLNGVTVSSVYPDTERFLFDFGLGIGSKITVKRSGKVIPRISHVEGVAIPTPKMITKMREEVAREGNLRKFEFGKNIDNHTFPDGKYHWNENFIDLVSEDSNDDIQIQKNIAFFEILKVEGISDSTITDLYGHGHETVADILGLILDKSELLASYPGWGERSSTKLREEIANVLGNGIELHKLQHASTCFVSLGSKKLLLLEDLNIRGVDAKIDDIVKLNGFDTILAENFIEGSKKFWEWYSTIEKFVKIKETTKTVMVSDVLAGKGFVFTGFRDKVAEDKLKEHGAVIQTTVSKNTTYLVMKEKGSGTTKEIKALSLGVEILSPLDLEEILNSL